jgi:hypothetical protein
LCSEEDVAAARRVDTERIPSGRKAVPEEPQDTTLSERDNPQPPADAPHTETSADEAEQADSEDAEADFEAHGSWGGIG